MNDLEHNNRKKEVGKYKDYIDSVVQSLSKGSCLLCPSLKGEVSFVKSHSVPKGIIKKMTSSKVYQIQNSYILFSSKQDEIEGNILENIKYAPKPAGVFYNLCNDCEKSEGYENKIGKDIFANFDNKDYIEIYLKSLCATKYKNDVSNKIFNRIRKDLSNDYFNFHRTRFFALNEIIEIELEHMKSSLQQNSINGGFSIEGKSMVIFDSADYSVQIPALKFSALSFYVDTEYFFHNLKKEVNNISIFIASDKKQSRVILMGENTEQSIHLKWLFSLLFHKTPETVVKAILYTMVQYRFEGVLFTDDCDMKEIYKLYKESRNFSDEMLLQFDTNTGFSSDMLNNLHRIDNLFDLLSY